MPIHAVFDILAWSLALAIRFLYVRRGDFGHVALPPELAFPYKIALLSGASFGAVLCGTANLAIQFPNLLGHSVIGAILGGIVAVEVFKRHHGIRGSTGVVWVVPLSVGIAVGRLGCFFSGLPDYTYGISTDLPWGVDFGDGILRHPVQLYESMAMTLFTFVVAFLVERKNVWFRDNGFYAFVAFYAGQRFVWEFLKPYAAIIGPFNFFHFICLALITYGVAMMQRRRLV